ncbi:hypothetical protein QUF79_14480 [Fictibacillus enclensis]|uniref:hypothetical protein n=1 Tax=Fictibacillus enclensis TaxID=1017270 RepID=UPI0025A009C7|nr:hypothetical protein [Fictibacillus enclensis]MDM5199224.1 hypothetical protein [Fictibacillus enclensis]
MSLVEKTASKTIEIMATGFGNAIGEVFHIFASIVPELTGLCLMLSGIGLMFGSLQKGIIRTGAICIGGAVLVVLL